MHLYSSISFFKATSPMIFFQEPFSSFTIILNFIYLFIIIFLNFFCLKRPREKINLPWSPTKQQAFLEKNKRKKKKKKKIGRCVVKLRQETYFRWWRLLRQCLLPRCSNGNVPASGGPPRPPFLNVHALFSSLHVFGHLFSMCHHKKFQRWLRELPVGYPSTLLPSGCVFFFCCKCCQSNF